MIEICSAKVGAIVDDVRWLAESLTEKRVQLVELSTTHPRTYRETCTTCRTYRAREKLSHLFFSCVSCTSCTRFCASCTVSSTQFYKLYTFLCSNLHLGVAATVVVVVWRCSRFACASPARSWNHTLGFPAVVALSSVRRLYERSKRVPVSAGKQRPRVYR